MPRRSQDVAAYKQEALPPKRRGGGLMPNPHRRCKVCKERHAPGNCQEVGVAFRADVGGGLDWMSLAKIIGELFTSSLELVVHIERGKGKFFSFEEGSVGGEKVKRLRAVLDKAAKGR